MTQTAELWGLPDAELHPEFYADVPAKRFMAFVVDTILITLISLLLIPFTAFTALFFFGFLWAAVAFIYRAVSIARASATPGMRLFSIEFRDHDGARLSLATALVHTTLFFIWMSMVLPQIVSIILMMTTPRAQGLSDHLLGTAAINRAAL